MDPIFSLICYYLLIFSLLQIFIGLSVLRLVANEYRQITIRSLSTICNIQSGIRWAITKVILNYLPLPNQNPALLSKIGLGWMCLTLTLIKNGWILAHFIFMTSLGEFQLHFMRIFFSFENAFAFNLYFTNNCTEILQILLFLNFAEVPIILCFFAKFCLPIKALEIICVKALHKCENC